MASTHSPIDQVAADIIAQLGWDRPWFLISAISREGTLEVCQQAQRFFEEARLREEEAAAEADAVAGLPQA